ncbi:hypothetical protein HQ531_02735 [bacterium]|nr:hypothetical protein [bacterium]
MSCSLYLPRWFEVLIAIQRASDRLNYSQKLNRQVMGSLTHLRAIVKLLEKYHLIEIQPDNKIKRIELTDRGRQISINIQHIQEQLRLRS